MSGPGGSVTKRPASVLIIGSGPVVIGQAAEFDYAGTQACRALREEGVRTILLNSNPATIMTDPGVADAIYLLSYLFVTGSPPPSAPFPVLGFDPLGSAPLGCF